MDISEATAAWADYVNGLPFARENFDSISLDEYEQDLGKARAEMERAWLEAKPVCKK